MTNSGAIRVASAAIVAAVGLVAALLDPRHWYVMFAAFLIAGGLFLLLVRADSPSVGGVPPPPRRPVPQFGPPPSVFFAGWGVILLGSGVLWLGTVYLVGLGFIFLYIWIAMIAIVLLVASQIRRSTPDGN